MKTVNMFKLINLGTNNDEPDSYYLFVETGEQDFLPVEDNGTKIELENILITKFSQSSKVIRSEYLTHTDARKLWKKLISIGYKEI